VVVHKDSGTRISAGSIGYPSFREHTFPRTPVNKGKKKKRKGRDLMTRQEHPWTLRCGPKPDAEPDHGLRDALIMEAHPVALAEFGSSPSMLILIDLPRGEL
jgi:hypothetical protein